MDNQILCGDFKELVKDIPDESVDLVFSDPPYPKKFQHTYDYLADYCPRIMKDGASLITIAAHYSIPYIIKAFDGKLKYRWLLCMNQFDGPHARMAMGIEITFKPLLWYVKRAYPQGRGFLRDGVKISGVDGQLKKHHKWEQDLDWAVYYIRKLTDEGDTVLDPYCGSGTVPIACALLNRRYIGIDIDQESIDETNRRLNNLDTEVSERRRVIIGIK